MSKPVFSRDGIAWQREAIDTFRALNSIAQRSSTEALLNYWADCLAEIERLQRLCNEQLKDVCERAEK